MPGNDSEPSSAGSHVADSPRALQPIPRDRLKPARRSSSRVHRQDSTGLLEADYAELEMKYKDLKAREKTLIAEHKLELEKERFQRFSMERENETKLKVLQIGVGADLNVSRSQIESLQKQLEAATSAQPNQKDLEEKLQAMEKLAEGRKKEMECKERERQSLLEELALQDREMAASMGLQGHEEWEYTSGPELAKRRRVLLNGLEGLKVTKSGEAPVVLTLSMENERLKQELHAMAARIDEQEVVGRGAHVLVRKAEEERIQALQQLRALQSAARQPPPPKEAMQQREVVKVVDRASSAANLAADSAATPSREATAAPQQRAAGAGGEGRNGDGRGAGGVLREEVSLLHHQVKDLLSELDSLLRSREAASQVVDPVAFVQEMTVQHSLQLVTLRDQQRVMEAENKALQAKVESLKVQLGEAEAASVSWASLQQTLLVAKASEEQLQHRCQSLETQLKAATDKCEELRKENSSMVNTLSTTLRVREEEMASVTTQKDAAEQAQHAAVTLIDSKVTEVEQTLTLLRAESIRADRAQALVTSLQQELRQLKEEAAAAPPPAPTVAAHPIALRFSCADAACVRQGHCTCSNAALSTSSLHLSGVLPYTAPAAGGGGGDNEEEMQELKERNELLQQLAGLKDAMFRLGCEGLGAQEDEEAEERVVVREEERERPQPAMSAAEDSAVDRFVVAATSALRFEEWASYYVDTTPSKPDLRPKSPPKSNPEPAPGPAPPTPLVTAAAAPGQASGSPAYNYSMTPGLPIDNRGQSRPRAMWFGDDNTASADSRPASGAGGRPVARTLQYAEGNSAGPPTGMPTEVPTPSSSHVR